MLHCRAHACIGLIRPVDTPGFGIDRIHRSRVHAQKNAPSGNGGLPVNFLGTRKSEGPLQFQVRNLRGG